MNVFPLTNKKTPAVPSGTDWRDYAGDVATSIYGVGVPKGIFVIDVDLYKGVTYEDINLALSVALDWDASLLQRTRSGGAHHGFIVPLDADLTNGTDVLVKGLDTRSSGKGYIATGEGYTDATQDTVTEMFELGDFVLPELPSEVLALFKAGQARVTENAGSEICDLMTAVANADTLGMPIDEMRDYLECMPADSADTDWLTVVMAIYHETGGSEEGYALLDEWSKTCPEKYDETGNRKRWESARNDANPNPVTFKSVIKLAGGATATSTLKVKRIKESVQSCTTRQELDAMLTTIANEKFNTIDTGIITGVLIERYFSVAGVKLTKGEIKKELKTRKTSEHMDDCEKGDFVSDYVFCTTTGLYMNRVNLTEIGPRSFSTKHNRETPLNSEGVFQNATTYADHTITTVDMSMYLPWSGEFFTMDNIEYYNTYRKVEHADVEVGNSDAVSRVLEHAEWLLPEDREREILLSFVAHQIQNTGKLLHWALVLQGIPGDGKSFWAEMMTHILGHNNVGTVLPTQFGSKFNAWAQGKVLNVIEELKVQSGSSQYDVLNQVKPLITNTKINIEGKGTNSKDVINTVNYFATTNFKDAVPIDSLDRRWAVLFTEERDVAAFCETNKDHFPSLYKVMRDNIPELYKFFSQYSIPKWFSESVRAPLTTHRDSMIELAKSFGEELFDSALEEFEGEFINSETVDMTYLFTKITAMNDSGDVRYQEFPSAKAVRKILLNSGYTNMKRVMNTKGKMHRIYSKSTKK